jgi:hypothetical protein
MTKRKEKKKRMKTREDQLNDVDPQPLRHSKMFHHDQRIESAITNNTFKKGCDGDAVVCPN